MAVTLNKIVYDILNIASRGQQSDDFPISVRQCEIWVHELRAKLISQAISKKGDILDNWVQHINCLDLETVDAAECCEIDTECTILKSVQQLPSYLEVISVRDITNKLSFTPTNLFRAKYVSGNKYTANRPRYYMKNQYLYIINNDVLEKVSLSAVFEDPTELSSFTDCTNSTCYNSDMQYPVNLKMATDIVDIILRTKVIPALQMPSDNTNDANNTNQQAPNIK